MKFYVGGYSNKIVLCNADIKKSSLSVIADFPANNATYLALTRNKKIIYAVSEVENTGGGVSAYAVGSDLKLTYLNAINGNESYACHLSTNYNDKILFESNYGDGTLSIFEIDGRLIRKNLTINHYGKSIDPLRQDHSYLHFAREIPGSKEILACDLGADMVILYEFDDNYTRVKTKTEFKIKPGSGPRHIAFEKSYFYLINELSCELHTYLLDLHNKKIELISCTNLKKSAADTAAAIRINDNFLITSLRGWDMISVFKLDRNGCPVLINEFDCCGECPRDFDLKDNQLIVANEISGTVCLFDFNKGFAKLADKIDVPGAACICLAD